MMPVNERELWKKLEGIAEKFKWPESLEENKVSHQTHLECSEVSGPNILLDYKEQNISQRALDLLIDLAHECKLKDKINELLMGYDRNGSGKAPALHTALRATGNEKIYVNDKNIIPDVLEAREDMRRISEQVRAGEWLGYTGKPITDVVNIGIGGSMLGPLFCVNALSDYVTPKLDFHFIFDITHNAFNHVIKRLNPETTLFIVSSKSFTTQETLSNFQASLDWLNQPEHLDKHYIAVTANVEQAKSLGIKHVVPIWDWVVGRFSACSAINLMTCIAIGYEQFLELLDGARQMDQHYRNEDFSNNLPVILALLGIWNNNFLNIHNLLVLTYAHDLQELVPYLQQMDMESNGKTIDMEGRIVHYATAPIVWGGSGNQAQHSYFQLLSNGTHQVCIDLVSVKIFDDHMSNKMRINQKTFLNNGQGRQGKTGGFIPGKASLNHIYLKDCSPQTIGSLIAMSEHRIFTQSVIWNINPFEQSGVDQLKQMARQLS